MMAKKTYPMRIPETLMKEIRAVKKSVKENTGLPLSFNKACLIVAFKSRQLNRKLSVEEFKEVMEDNYN